MGGPKATHEEGGWQAASEGASGARGPSWGTIERVAEITDVFTLGFRSTVRGQQVANTFHVRQNPTAGPVDVTHLRALLADAFTDTLILRYRGLLPTVGTLDYVIARLVHDPQFPDAPRPEAIRNVAQAGTFASADDDALELCAVLTLGTELAGRRYRGRQFAPPPLEKAQHDDESWDPAGGWWANFGTWEGELSKTCTDAGAAHYGGAWNDNDLCVYSLRARQLAVDPYYARVISRTRRGRLRWLRSRGPSV